VTLGQWLPNYLQMSIHPTSMWSAWPKPNSATRVLFEISVYRAERISAENAHGGGSLNCYIWQCHSVTRSNDLELAEGCVWVEVPSSVGFSLLIGDHYCAPDTTADTLKEYFGYLQHVQTAHNFRILRLGDFNVPYFTGNLDCLLPFLNTTINWRAKPYCPSCFYSAYLSIIIIATQTTCLITLLIVLLSMMYTCCCPLSVSTLFSLKYS